MGNIDQLTHSSCWLASDKNPGQPKNNKGQHKTVVIDNTEHLA